MYLDVWTVWLIVTVAALVYGATPNRVPLKPEHAGEVLLTLAFMGLLYWWVL